MLISVLLSLRAKVSANFAVVPQEGFSEALESSGVQVALGHGFLASPTRFESRGLRHTPAPRKGRNPLEDLTLLNTHLLNSIYKTQVAHPLGRRLLRYKQK